MNGDKSYEEKLYALLNTAKYCNGMYENVSLGEGLSVINQVIWGWWKPRYLLNHNNCTAFEFMDGNECLVTVTQNDIDWDSLDGLPHESIQVARRLSFHYPSFIRGFRNGTAQVDWQLNPDGRYFSDDDGFGMTDDNEIVIYGFIDSSGNVLVNFRRIKNYDELESMRAKAELIIKDGIINTL